MNDALLSIYVTLRLWPAAMAHRIAEDERGEGVISAAIAVLIMAFLGALMWVGFKSIWTGAEGNINNQVNQIGT